MIGNVLYAIICAPFSSIATVLNIIFILCLCRPAAGVSLRQPLQLLLTAMVFTSTFQHCILLVTVIIAFMNVPNWLLVGTKALVYLAFTSCFSSNAWISNFYHIKVVPHHSTVFIWIQKHVKTVVCSGFIVDQIILFAAMSMGTVPYLFPSSSLNSTSSTSNGTATVVNKNISLLLADFCNLILTLYLVVPVFTLSVSWGRTFIYLRGHIKKMAESTGPGSKANSQQKNQMRVTIMGIIQTALFLPSCMWTIFTVITYSTPLFLMIDGNRHITMSITSFSALANIVCLGFSQSVFRSTVGDKLKSFKKACGLWP